MYSSSQQDANANNNNVISDNHGGISIPISDDPATLIHTSFAKVYTMPISPTKKTWLPQTLTAVPVSFYYDRQRNVYRILSYGDGDSKPVVNSTIVPNMSFLKTSPFFGLWSDRKLRVIFGLGFASQSVCDLTADWFDKIVKAATDLEQSSQNNNVSPVKLPPFETHQLKSITNESTPRRQKSFTIQQKGGIDPVVPTEDYTPNTDRIAIAVGDAIRQQSVKCLVQDEEKDRKLIGLEQEVLETKFNLNQVQESLTKRVEESEKLWEEVKDLKEQLQIQINRAETTENFLTEERSRAHSLELELGQLNGIISQQIVTINDLQKEKREIGEESKMLRDSLRFNRVKVDEADVELNNLGGVCREISSKVEDMLKIQERLQTSLKITQTMT